MNYGFIIDNRRCIGCHACTVACKSEHNTPIGVNRTWVKYVEKGAYPDTRRIFSVHRCNHCADAPCVEICPVTSLFIREDGIVDFDNQRCIGCKACMQACPYDALHIDPQTHTSSKCNYCAHRVDHGIEPACVIVCPVHAIVSGDMDDPASEIAHLLSRQTVTVRKPEKGTRPKLFYINGDDAALTPGMAPLQTVTVQSDQTAGVGHHAHASAAKAAGDGRLRVMGDSVQPSTPAPTPPERSANVEVRRTYDAPSKGVLWDWEVSGYLWTKSIAAGLVFLPLLMELTGMFEIGRRLGIALSVLSLIFLGLTGALLVKDLDRPERFLNVLLRPQWKSWLVRGAYIITAFGGLTTLWFLMNIAGVQGGWFFKLLLIVAAILTAVYTAFLFAQAKGRDLWQSPLLPLRMLLTSVLTGLSLLLIVTLLGQMGPQPAVRALLIAALLLHLGLVAAEMFLTHVTADTAAAMHQLTQGPLRMPFLSSIVLGALLPLLLLALSGSGLAIFPAAVLVLTFALVHEHVWVQAPQRVPLR